jgi:alkylation response protein AidB-like acyl-CoA dehydrogenase
MKLHYADLGKRVYRLGIEILGPRSLALVDDEAETEWVDKHVQSCAMSIGGGTSEIQRNIIAERVLGLPR